MYTFSREMYIDSTLIKNLYQVNIKESNVDGEV